MGITYNNTLPVSSYSKMDKHLEKGQTQYVLFIASKDPKTDAPWCSDVRAAMPVLLKYFTQHEEKELMVVEVGSVDAWKKSDNIFRKNWSIQKLPTLVRFDRSPGDDDESLTMSQLIEDECKVDGKIAAFCR